MAGDNTQEQTWMEKLQHTYRLVVMNNETFEETGSYQLTLLNVYIMLSTIVVIVAFIVVLLIAFTPLRRYIPGYGDVNQIEKVMVLQEKVDAMEEELEAHRTYTESFRRMLTNDVETETDVPQVEESASTNGETVERIAEDEQLRKEVQLEEIGSTTAVIPINEEEADEPTNTEPINPAIEKTRPAGNNGGSEINGQRLEQMFFVAPVTGEISADFMLDKKHYGVDVLAPKNTPVKAALDGFVFMSDWTLETGNTIGIQHTNNVITFYKHNSALLKKAGSYVKAGEAVAIIGNTGTLSNGPHLHFELWYKGKAVNPKDYINF